MDKEDQDGRKQVSKKFPSSQTEQDEYDRLVCEAAIDPQGPAYTLLEMLESDESELDEEVEDEVQSDGNFVRGRRFVDLMFREEGEESNTESEMEEEDDENDIDPDELSYEELLFLGEIIGQESRGLPPEEVSLALIPHTCKATQSRTSIDRCVICQVEYEEGEKLVALRCEHLFHVGCISPWLEINKVCPICSKEVIKHKTE